MHNVGKEEDAEETENAERKPDDLRHTGRSLAVRPHRTLFTGTKGSAGRSVRRRRHTSLRQRHCAAWAICALRIACIGRILRRTRADSFGSVGPRSAIVILIHKENLPKIYSSGIRHTDGVFYWLFF